MNMAIESRTFPLSTGQLGLWLAQTLDPGTVMNGGQYVAIQGAIDPERFERALRHVVDEADALRLQVVGDAQDPRQVVVPRLEWRLPIVDVSSDPDPHTTAEAWMTADLARPVDPRRDPLFGFALFNTAPDRWLWYARLHHLACDAYGRWLVTLRTAAIYDGLAGSVGGSSTSSSTSGSSDALGSLETWLEEDAASRDSAACDSDRAYWLHTMQPAPRPVPLVPRAAVAGRTVRQRVSVSAAVKARLRELARQAGSTLPQIVNAAVATWVCRMTDADDAVLGIAVRNRVSALARRTPGMSSNILPLRVRPDLHGRLIDLVRHIAATTREAVRHQRYRIEELRRALGVHPGGVDLFWPSVNYQGFDYDLRLGGHATSLHSLPQPFTDDLTIIVHDRSEASDLEINVDANSLAYRAADLAGYASQLACLLASAADARDDWPIGRLDLISAAEASRRIDVATSVTRAYPLQSIATLFDAQAAHTPDAIAVVSGESHITYATLRLDAMRLACELRRQGVRREDRVAVCLDRGVPLIVALLGIVKAGAAYVPLDPECPPERLAYMLDDSGARVLLTQQTLRERLPRREQVILTIEDACTDAGQDESLASSHPDDLAYVMYTSGSTGMPKGTAVTHRAIANLACNHFVELHAGDRLGQASNASFDALTFEVWGALLSGGTIVTIPHDIAIAPRALGALLHRQRIDTLFLTTALFNEIAREAPDAFDGLRDLLFGGEAVDPQWPRAVRARHGVRRLLHVYGPTETTTFATWHHLDTIASDATTIPIGVPIANARAYVLDRFLQPVPAGGIGDLYLAGPGLARGYWARAAATAERFVADPHGDPGSRMYRTGDVVSWQADGTLAFIGRRDRQIKLRGFRVEPGEIEMALRHLPDVRDAVVVVHEQTPGNKRLVGYVVPLAGRHLDGHQLRHRLERTLPPYMLPSAVMVLESLPVTPLGKVDRRALPPPAPPAEARDTYRPPRTPEEAILCDAFAEVLGVARIGLDDDFFELGGHSLLATRVVSRIRATQGIELAIRTLFESSTVADLSQRLRNAGPARPPLVPQVRPELIPASGAQRRLWFTERLEGGTAAYHIQDAWRLRGPLDVDALRAAINSIVRRHESLRTRFAEVGGRLVQVVSPTQDIPLPIDDLRGTRTPIADILRREREAPFDLSNGPLLRLRLLWLSADDYVLVRMLHHIVSDGWSQGVFNRELSRFYAAHRANGPADPLPPLPVQYADFAIWQSRWLEEESIRDGLAYWTTQLAGIPERLALPTDRPRPEVQTFAADRYETRLSAAETSAVRQTAQQHHSTLFMTLLAAFSVVLSRTSGQEDVVIGTPIANRQDAALEGLIGCFVNALSLRVRLNGEASFATLLHDVRHTTLEAYRHQDVPFERVVEAVAPARRPNTPPLFQVMLALQNAPAEAPCFEALAVEAMEAGSPRVRFDLEVHAFEQDGQIALSWIYNTALFDRWRIAQLATQYTRILAVACADASLPIDAIPLLDADEQRRLIEDVNTATQVAPSASIAELFDAQAARTPDAIAIVEGTQALSYATLRERADRLARQLVAAGIGAEEVVAIDLPRSLDWIIAALAVLKAGGAYLPLDPQEPAARRAAMLREARAQRVLTADALDTTDDADGVPVDPIAPDRLAYVMYTSGSTGLPKGIMVTHGAIAHLVRDTNYVALGPGDRVAQIATTSFDAATFEIWGALLNGATVAVIDTHTAVSPRELGAALARLQIGTAFLTTALFHQIARDQPDACGGLRTVLFGGESVDPRCPRAVLRSSAAPARLLHVYGPTETTTFASWSVLTDADVESDGATPPIGGPVSGTQLYVLDRRLIPTPPGVAGELYIAGTGLARGYVSQPAFTARRFVANPYGPPGSRMYRSGDIVRRRVDGRIEFVGRVDRQIKLRGFRVELHEIEAAFRQHPDVRDCLVTLVADASGGRLVAYWIPADTATPGRRADLRQHLQQRLPAYMLPADFEPLAAWPLTSHGKIDLAALPAPGSTREDEEHNAPPQDALQAVLVDVWKRMLQRDDVGIFDNYFDLGAHSLMIVQVQKELESLLDCRIRVIDLFTYSTVASLADFLRTQRAGVAASALAPAARPEAGLDDARAGRSDRLTRRLARRRRA
jgi:nonribosomal peptide synthetase DhbF